MGSLKTRVVVGEFIKGEKNPRVIGAGEVPTMGVRHGYINSFDEVVISIKTAIRQAEKSSGVRIKKAYISISDMTLRGVPSSASVVISKADGEVTHLDINKVLGKCEKALKLQNKKVLHVFPVSYKLDGEEVLGSPEGMHGNKLEVKALLVTTGVKHWEEMVAAISEAGITPIDVVAGPVSASLIAMSERHKMVGSALLDIGAETTSLAVFENNTLIALRAFSIGSTDVTNDIALGLKIGLEEAEGLKLGDKSSEHPQKKLDEIIEARFSDVFDLVDKHLKKIKRSELLPAGIIFVGGGANSKNIEDYAKKSLNLPAMVGSTKIFGNAKTKLKDPAWFTALGLIIYGQEDLYQESNPFLGVFKDVKSAIKGGFRQILP